jgi:hypothetical protein
MLSSPSSPLRAAAPKLTTSWNQEERCAVLTVKRILDEPNHSLQPLPEDALLILDVAIKSSNLKTADDISNLIVLVSRSIDWIEKAHVSTRLRSCREFEDVLEDWMCLLVQLEEQTQKRFDSELEFY